MRMPRDYAPPEPVMPYFEPESRKRSLKTYSKGDLIRYALELESRIERYQQQDQE